MKNDPYRIAYLVAGFIRNTLNDQERDELDEWVVASPDNMALFGDLTDDNNIEQSLEQVDNLDQQEELKRLLSRVAEERPAPRRIKWWYAAAAVVVLAIIGLLVFRTEETKSTVASEPTAIVKDIEPAPNRATLTVEGGTVIDLAAADQGVLRQANSAVIHKTSSNTVNYQTVDAVAGETVFHVLTVPGGGQFSVILSDGTKVWLNAASSLRYPAQFNKSDRTVELIGEAYFEVAKKQNPFIVKTSDDNAVMVFGTHFNVKAYRDEMLATVTLLEGSVAIERKGNKTMLVPGEQAHWNEDEVKVETPIDAASAIAWKDGLFKFTDATIDDIMKQVERWYDAKILFEAKIAHHFNATLPRDKPVSQLLRYLEMTGQVHFKIDNNKITVMK